MDSEISRMRLASMGSTEEEALLDFFDSLHKKVDELPR
jgi:hypothetical protein